jgi:transcriptional regulator with XRE-family HTH domain
MDKKMIGKKLAKLRGNKTQEEVAKALNVSVSAIGMYESGQRIPRDEVKKKISDYYSCSVGEIFFTEKVHEM